MGNRSAVPKGTTVYQAAKQLGIEIPIFCYQDRMPPFGACRMCLVEVGKWPKPQTSCTLEATEGMVVKTQSAMAVEGRKEIIGISTDQSSSRLPYLRSGRRMSPARTCLQIWPRHKSFF